MSEQRLVEPESFGEAWAHKCDFHQGAEIEPIGENGENLPGCPECGCLLEWDVCDWCGVCYLVFGDNWIDDVIRSASANLSGDLMCARCARDEAEEEENDFGEEEDWGDDYP